MSGGAGEGGAHWIVSAAGRAYECSSIGTPHPFELHTVPGAEPDLVDVVAVERACAGDRVRLTDAELSTAVRRLRRAGWSRAAIMEQLDAPERVVLQETTGIDRGRLRVRATARGVAA